MTNNENSYTQQASGKGTIASEGKITLEVANLKSNKPVTLPDGTRLYSSDMMVSAGLFPVRLENGLTLLKWSTTLAIILGINMLMETYMDKGIVEVIRSLFSKKDTNDQKED